MRKFITIIFLSMMITVSAFGGSAPDNYKEPKISDYSDKWTLDNFTNTINSYANVLTPKEGKGNKACEYHGTQTDECSYILYIARQITSDGGRFCLTQIQAGNKDNKYYTWIDYYEPESDYTDCINLCSSGTCSSEQTCNLNDHDWRKPDKENTTYFNQEKSSTPFTTSMNVLDFQNEQAKDGPASRQAWHYVLGIVDTKPHGAVVAPMKIIAQRSRPDGADFAWIVSAQASTNTKLLCESGYIPNDSKTDCVKSSTCDANQTRCAGFETGFDESIHEIVKSSDTSSNCYKYKCKQTGYGLASSSDHSCIQCNKSKKWGANEKTGYICKECATGEIFHETNSCQSARSISKQTMFEKWKKTTINEFKCALGIDTTNTCKDDRVSVTSGTGSFSQNYQVIR